MPNPITKQAYKFLDQVNKTSLKDSETYESNIQNSAIQKVDFAYFFNKSNINGEGCNFIPFIFKANSNFQLQDQLLFKNQQKVEQPTKSKIVQNIIISEIVDATQQKDGPIEVKTNGSLNNKIGHENQVQTLEAHSIQHQQKCSTNLQEKKNKKKQLKKSNAYKNLMNQFVNYFINKQKQIKQIYGLDVQSMKNIKDNLKKKIKYEKRSQKIQNFISMLQHHKYQKIIVGQCIKFMEVYPEIVQNSKKIKDKQTNKVAIREVQNLLKDKNMLDSTNS